MREIKFRAFIKGGRWPEIYDVLGKIFQVTELNFCDSSPFMAEVIFPGDEFEPYGGTCLCVNDYELMQYIGLKDKNGKEIYEGDIVSYCLDEKLIHDVCLGVVLFDEEELTYTVSIDNLFISYISKVFNINIIGNIYQNPDLLKIR